MVSDNRWDEYVSRAKAYVATGLLDVEEIDYKVEIAVRLSATRDAALAGVGDWVTPVKRDFSNNNLTPWRQQQRFRLWLDDSRNDALRALRAIWTRDASGVAERIRNFSELLPTSVTGGGAGTRVRVISVLLMGVNAYQYPPFGIRVLSRAYDITGYGRPERNTDEAAVYEHFLGFLDCFIGEAAKRGLEFRHRLDAQSVVWALHEGRDKVSQQLDPPEQVGLYLEDSYEEDASPSAMTLAELADDLTLPVDFLEEIQTLLDDKKQVIFQGPPGTGKTYVARELAAFLAGSRERVTLVQFHPTYSYEDFVRGYRPTLVNRQAGFTLRDGPLVRAANAVNRDKDNKHFLIIDEINRGNLAGVFGELYFLLEYRDEEISLQYSEEDEKFSLPDNLYIIGTMNTADRSIALVDLALRRRFYFVEFHPDDEPIDGLLRRWLNTNGLGGMDWVANVVDRANELLRDDRHAAIGPSYFMKDDLDEAAVERIWKHSVLPYIEERLFGQDGRLGEFQLDMLRGRAQDDSGNAENEATVASESDTESDSGGE